MYYALLKINWNFGGIKKGGGKTGVLGGEDLDQLIILGK